MTFKQILLASCALVICATAANAQIPSYVPTDGLVGWWPFNGNANDESGNGNNGVVNGATLTEDRNGVANAAYSFNGQALINAGALINFGNSNAEISQLGWFKTTANQFCKMPLVTKRHNTTSGNGWASVMFKYDNLGYLNFVVDDHFYANGINNPLSSEPVEHNDGNWHHFAAIKNQSDYSLYMDGQLVDSRIDTYNFGLSSNDYMFGYEGSFGFLCERYYTGLLDDIAIYNRALTPQEIQNLYNGTTETVDTGNGAAPLPQGIPYQAAARDAQGQSLVNAAVNVRFTLHESAADGAASYAETHALTTNSVGLFNTVFGNGTPEQSAFDSIIWAATTKFLQVEIDLGEGYVDMGTTQLLSVPYALRSDEAARVKNAGLPVFNDNAAALAGGLVAGEMYRTAAGVLMVAY